MRSGSTRSSHRPSLPLVGLWFVAVLLVLDVKPCSAQNIVTEWTQLHLDFIRETFGFLSPPAVSRALVVLQTCLYDTWTAYDAVAIPTIPTNGVPKVPVNRITQANINESISYAAYRALFSIFYSKQQQLFELDNFFAAKGYDRFMTSTDTNTAAGIGNKACLAVIEARKKDGMNSEGTHPNSVLMPYSDYTGYVAVNPAQTTTGITDCSKLVSMNKWQPLKVATKAGGTVTQKWAAAQTPLVTPFALPSAMSLRPDGPPMYGPLANTQDVYIEQYTQVLNLSATLDDTMKAVAEFWADGPDSTLPPGHWHSICLQSIYRENLNLAQSLKLLFMNAHSSLDAAIACWDAKRFFDSARPITAIQCLYQNSTVTAWKGPYQGVGAMPGSQWQPYQNKFFVTPAFAGYVSGHSTYSGSSAEVLKLFFGDDRFRGNNYTLLAGKSLFEPMIPQGQPGYVAGVTDVPNSGPNTVGYSPATDIPLSWSTWTEAADEAGFSRLLGGIHTEADNVDGLALGRKIGKLVFEKATTLFNGGVQNPCNCPPVATCEEQPINAAGSFSLFSTMMVTLMMVIATLVFH